MQKTHRFMQNTGLRRVLFDALGGRWVRRWARGALAGLWVGLAGAAYAASPNAAPVRVMAASNMKFALAHIIKNYQDSTGQRIEVTYGSSGNMARQVLQGLPADLFMSADEAMVEQLAAAGKTRSLRGPNKATGTANATQMEARELVNGVADPGVVYAQGRLAVVVPWASTLVLDAQLTALQKAVADTRYHGKFAIANPEHAPYGRAAQQALQTLGLWTLVQPHVVLGENIAQSTQFVATGAASMGITALSLAQAPELAGQVRYLALPTHLHAPLRQRMVLLKGASPAAEAFYTYLQQPQTRAVLLQYGFEAPP